MSRNVLYTVWLVICFSHEFEGNYSEKFDCMWLAKRGLPVLVLERESKRSPEVVGEDPRTAGSGNAVETERVRCHTGRAEMERPVLFWIHRVQQEPNEV